jgi:NAD(P)-dependent dehydrogenase (short-subunit alcohol dehydrogenase family)
LWGLVNNAGILGNISAIDMLTPQDYHQVMEVNFHGLVGMTLTFLPLLKQSRGRIVNVSSVAGIVPFDRLSPYVASKHAIQGFTDSTR